MFGRWPRQRRVTALTAAVTVLLCLGLLAGYTVWEQHTPRPGGTLRMVGAGDADSLDPAVGYTPPAFTVFRATLRQLVAYPAATDQTERSRPVPDLAESVPTPLEQGHSYVFRIRAGARWNTSPPRQITAFDVARGFKRLCNPTNKRFGSLGYYVGVIDGMDTFCEGFAQVSPDVDQMRAYIESHPVNGIEVVDERTVRFRLVRPAGDFLNILALPSSSPAPLEALNHLPDSPESQSVASGPYQVAEHRPQQSLELVRNPAWDPETDPVRRAWVDRIRVEQGVDDVRVLQRLRAGTADLSWDTFVPPDAVAGLRRAGDERLSVEQDGSLSPYLVLNLRSPREGGALGRLPVRQALNLAVDKAALVDLLGGPALNQVQTQVLTPPLDGFRPFDPFPTTGHRGDPARARQLLRAAGHPDGLDLTFVYRDAGASPAVARRLRTDLARSGIRLQLRPLGSDAFFATLRDPAQGAAGGWDLAAPSWVPDWPGNAARSFFVPLLDGRGYGPGSVNYGGYRNPRVEALVDEALQATAPERAADSWARADRLAMADAPWVPLLTGASALYRGERVRGWVFSPLLKNGDPTNVWLARQ